MSKKSAVRHKPGTASKLLLAIVTAINLALTLALSIQRRREIVRAVSGEDGKVQLLLEEAAKKGE